VCWWWAPQARGSWDQNPPTIGTDHTTAGPPYMASDFWRPSFSSRRCPHLERPAAPRHVRIISACFPKPSEDAPLPAFFPKLFFIACEVTLFISDTLIVHLTYMYLLTYISTLWLRHDSLEHNTGRCPIFYYLFYYENRPFDLHNFVSLTAHSASWTAQYRSDCTVRICSGVEA